jgi:hypothetical protein
MRLHACLSGYTGRVGYLAPLGSFLSIRSDRLLLSGAFFPGRGLHHGGVFVEADVAGGGEKV